VFGVFPVAYGGRGFANERPTVASIFNVYGDSGEWPRTGYTRFYRGPRRERRAHACVNEKSRWSRLWSRYVAQLARSLCACVRALHGRARRGAADELWRLVSAAATAVSHHHHHRKRSRYSLAFEAISPQVDDDGPSMIAQSPSIPQVTLDRVPERHLLSSFANERSRHEGYLESKFLSNLVDLDFSDFCYFYLILPPRVCVFFKNIKTFKLKN